MKIYFYKNNSSKVILFFCLAFLCVLTSCNSRQARIVGKIMHEIDHATDDDRYADSSEDGMSQQQDAMFCITGIVQYDNGRIVRLNSDDSPILHQTEEGLFLQYGLKRITVYQNEYATITETYDLPDNSEYEYSFGETATRPYDVEMYQFVCPMSDRTYYFSVKGKLN